MRISFVLHRLAGVTAASVLIAGCAATPASLGSMPQLAFDRTETAGPATAIAPAGSSVTAPTLATTTTGLMTPAAVAPISHGGGGSASAPAAVRKLRVDLSAFLAKFSAPAQRRVLATTADIDKLVLTVMQAGQPDQTATLTKAQLASGAADFTFNDLPAGNAIVFVVAYDAAGLPIGSAAQVVVISETSSAVAEMTVQLVPSTATSGPGGTLVTKTTFLDGPPPPAQPAGTVLLELDTLGIPVDLTPAPGGGMFVGTALKEQQTGNLSTAFFGAVVRVADDGTELFRAAGLGPAPALLAYAPSTAQLWTTWRGGVLIQPDGTGSVVGVNAARFALDAAGNAYGGDRFQSSGIIYKVTPAGVRTTTSMTGHSAITFDAAGNLWTAWATGTTPVTMLRRYAPDETLVGSYPVPGPIRQIAAAPTGEIWVIHDAAGKDNISSASAAIGPSSTHVSKLAPDGTLLGTYAVSARRLAFDAQGNVWVAGDTLTKLSSDGQVLATYPHQNCWSVAVDDLGYVWVGAQKANMMPSVRKLQP